MNYKKEIYYNVEQELKKLANRIAKEFGTLKVKSFRYECDIINKYKLYKTYNKKLFGFINIKKEYSPCSLYLIPSSNSKLKIQINCDNSIIKEIEKIIHCLENGFIDAEILLNEIITEENDKYDASHGIPLKYRRKI